MGHKRFCETQLGEDQGEVRVMPECLLPSLPAPYAERLGSAKNPSLRVNYGKVSELI